MRHLRALAGTCPHPDADRRTVSHSRRSCRTQATRGVSPMPVEQFLNRQGAGAFSVEPPWSLLLMSTPISPTTPQVPNPEIPQPMDPSPRPPTPAEVPPSGPGVEVPQPTDPMVPGPGVQTGPSQFRAADCKARRHRFALTAAKTSAPAAALAITRMSSAWEFSRQAFAISLRSSGLGPGGVIGRLRE